ncbi:hypothetical protein LMR83_20345 [Klebsiella quasipneumoniae subsp. similipneumoniae]|uniref:hypothetical protein n=1 Tax=Klebsiella quasipneumoniae TaxID=1463165 RepID=UPI001E32C0CD|nr:hypothetical protein [Klebsiella quasipneumoniae]MCC5462685.1 hypothetical protein [Klebsiella quasipneumoniae subsp. similipneumoniae]
MAQRYNTGNQRPSNSMKDLNDNALVYDDFLNGDADEVIDRLGKSMPTIRKTIRDANDKFHSQITLQDSLFLNSQIDKENRFASFLDSSGYVFLGEYQNGPFQFSARNQYIRYNNQYYRLNAATDVGFTTTGTDATSFANDVTHFVLMDGDTLRQNLGSSEEGMGDNLIERKLGGSVNAALRYVSVDGFSPDLTGETDSTSSVMMAAAIAKTLADSAYRTGDTTYYVVKFGFGIYMLGDVPLYSGISYEGQGAGTLIRPLPGADYCFTTTGTEKYDPANLKRMFYPAVSNLFIGCGYFEALFDIPENVGGINIKHASYLKLENISIRHLDGCGMNLSEVWDSDFDNIRIMYCGNTRDTTNIKYGLDINPGDNTVDGSNALRFNALHIETCPALLNIGDRSRHLSFICPKLEAQESDAYPSRIKNSRGISFVSPELTWGRSDEFMFDMTGDNQLISFASPVIISSLSKIGNYFHYDSTLGALSINNPQMRGVRQLVYGSNYKVSGGTAELSGPVLIDGTSNITVENVDWRHITQPAGGSTAPCLQVNGAGCKITGNKLHFAGAANDGFVGVYVGPLASDTQVTDNLFSGARSTALSIAAAAVPGTTQYGNRVVDGGAFTTLVSGSKPAFPLLYTGTPPQKYPVDFPGAVTLAPNAAYTFSGLTTASQLLIAASWTFSSALYSESAMVLMNNSATAVHVINSLRGMILDGSSGMTGAYIYITKSGNNYTVTNRYTETVTIKIAAINL